MTTKAAETGRTAVLVLGPPRSGTSAISHVLNKMGVEFGAPDDFVDPGVHTHNPIFFELRKLNELNDRILAELGIQYADFDYFHDPSAINPELAEAFAPEIRSLVEKELSGGRLIGLKDPRFVLTLPVWTSALEGLGYSLKFVLTTRSQEAVVRSNAVVNGFSESHNRRIAVLSEQLAAVQLRGRQVLIVDYDRVIEQPLAQSERIAAWLGANNADVLAAARVISGNLRHQASNEQLSLEPDATQNYLEERAGEFAHWRTSLNDIGIVELVDVRRKAVFQLQRDLLAATEQKWLEGRRFTEEIERLRLNVHTLEQQLLAANTLKAEEAKRWIVEAQELRDQLQETVSSAEARLQQEALAHHHTGLKLQEMAASAVEQLRRADAADQKYVALDAEMGRKLQETMRSAEARLQQEALAHHHTGLKLQEMATSAAEQLRRADAADQKYVALDAEMGRTRGQLVAMEQERADLNAKLEQTDARRAAADLQRDTMAAERDALGVHLERLSLRISGLERRQRWAIATAALAALAVGAGYLVWQ